MPRAEYKVEGYDVVTPEYDAPYHPSATFDPGVVFENAGDTEATAKSQKDRKRHPKDNLKASKRVTEKVVAALGERPVPEADPVKKAEPTPVKKAAAKKAPAKKAPAKKS